MPRMDGLEAARHIRKASPSVPIILHTLYNSAQVERAAKVMGIYKVISKTNTVDLVAELESLFRDRAPTRTEPLGKPHVSQVDGFHTK
jgi:CheY-like chemotaxis protein